MRLLLGWYALENNNFKISKHALATNMLWRFPIVISIDTLNLKEYPFRHIQGLKHVLCFFKYKGAHYMQSLRKLPIFSVE